MAAAPQPLPRIPTAEMSLIHLPSSCCLSTLHEDSPVCLCPGGSWPHTGEPPWHSRWCHHRGLYDPTWALKEQSLARHHTPPAAQRPLSVLDSSAFSVRGAWVPTFSAGASSTKAWTFSLLPGQGHAQHLLKCWRGWWAAGIWWKPAFLLHSCVGAHGPCQPA